MFAKPIRFFAPEAPGTTPDEWVRMRIPRQLRSSLLPIAGFAAAVTLAGCATGGPDESADSTSAAVSTATIANIALDNIGKGACSTNSKGSKDFDSSCTGNGGEPEYWCADFARWVWAAAGAETSGLTAAAGSFYVYGQDHGTLHSTPAVGDAVVFDYHGGGDADHVAIVVKVYSNGTIETVSGDWNGESGSEAHFSSTSHVVLNTAYSSRDGSYSNMMGMTISGFIAPAGTGGSSGGSPPAPSEDCYSDTLRKDMHNDACVQSASNDDWYQCDHGSWTDRWTDPSPCDGTYPLNNGGHSSGGGKGCYSDTLGKEMPDNACVQSASNDDWYQCDNGEWADRWTDPSACNGIHAL
jgi:hypothetical protein